MAAPDGDQENRDEGPDNRKAKQTPSDPTGREGGEVFVEDTGATFRESEDGDIEKVRRIGGLIGVKMEMIRNSQGFRDYLFHGRCPGGIEQVMTLSPA